MKDLSQGRVLLVGAGPGDPELLTVKALRAIQTADVVVFDRLVSPEIMALIPGTTRRIDVGKSPKCHKLPQDDINALLVALASDGLMVARLKGGDPLIFGRGSEEAAVLRKAGIDCDYIPGITSAQGGVILDRRAAHPSRAGHRRALCYRAPRRRCAARSRLAKPCLRRHHAGVLHERDEHRRDCVRTDAPRPARDDPGAQCRLGHHPRVRRASSRPLAGSPPMSPRIGPKPRFSSSSGGSSRFMVRCPTRRC